MTFQSGFKDWNLLYEPSRDRKHVTGSTGQKAPLCREDTGDVTPVSEEGLRARERGWASAPGPPVTQRGPPSRRGARSGRVSVGREGGQGSDRRDRVPLGDNETRGRGTCSHGAPGLPGAPGPFLFFRFYTKSPKRKQIPAERLHATCPRTRRLGRDDSGAHRERHSARREGGRGHGGHRAARSLCRLFSRLRRPLASLQKADAPSSIAVTALPPPSRHQGRCPSWPRGSALWAVYLGCRGAHASLLPPGSQRGRATPVPVWASSECSLVAR